MDSTQQVTVDQAELPKFLIGSLQSVDAFTKTCPTAQTFYGFNQSTNETWFIQVRCKRWGCAYCGQRKIAHFGYKVQAAEPNKLVTLTVWNDMYLAPREAFEATNRKITQLAVKLRRRYSEFEYFKVLEATKKGWPHYHLVVRSPYIPQQEISTLWAELTGAKIVDVRKIKKPSDVYNYVIKYLGKQKYIPWTDRRVSWSRKFWKDDGFKRASKLDLKEKFLSKFHPIEYLEREFRGHTVTQISQDAWTIEGYHVTGLGRPLDY